MEITVLDALDVLQEEAAVRNTIYGTELSVLESAQSLDTSRRFSLYISGERYPFVGTAAEVMLKMIELSV